MGTAARNLYFNLDNSAGSAQDLSAFVRNVEASDDVGLEDDTTFGSAVTDKSYVSTLIEGGFSISGPYHATLWAHLHAIRALTATSTFIIGPIGSTSTNPRITGECRMKSMKLSGVVDGQLMIEAEFLYDGAITKDTF